MKQAYADTTVPVAKSKEQIEKLLKGSGVVATRFTSYPMYAELAFIRQQGETRIPYRVTVKPKLQEYARNPARELDRAEQQVWRVVYWWLKAKLEAVEFGLVEFEQDFLPYMLVQDRGQTRTTAEVFFERLAGAISLPQDPFGGLRSALPPPGEQQDGESK